MFEVFELTSRAAAQRRELQVAELRSEVQSARQAATDAKREDKAIRIARSQQQVADVRPQADEPPPVVAVLELIAVTDRLADLTAVLAGSDADREGHWLV